MSGRGKESYSITNNINCSRRYSCSHKKNSAGYCHWQLQAAAPATGVGVSHTDVAVQY